MCTKRRTGTWLIECSGTSISLTFNTHVLYDGPGGVVPYLDYGCQVLMQISISILPCMWIN